MPTEPRRVRMLPGAQPDDRDVAEGRRVDAFDPEDPDCPRRLSGMEKPFRCEGREVEVRAQSHSLRSVGDRGWPDESEAATTFSMARQTRTFSFDRRSRRKPVPASRAGAGSGALAIPAVRTMQKSPGDTCPDRHWRLPFASRLARRPTLASQRSAPTIGKSSGPSQDSVALGRGHRASSGRLTGSAMPSVGRRATRRTGSLASGRPTEPESSPYPGLCAFTEADAEFFFGREVEVASLWEKMRRQELLALVAPPGWARRLSESWRYSRPTASVGCSVCHTGLEPGLRSRTGARPGTGG